MYWQQQYLQMQMPAAILPHNLQQQAEVAAAAQDLQVWMPFFDMSVSDYLQYLRLAAAGAPSVFGPGDTRRQQQAVNKQLQLAINVLSRLTRTEMARPLLMSRSRHKVRQPNLYCIPLSSAASCLHAAMPQG